MRNQPLLKQDPKSEPRRVALSQSVSRHCRLVLGPCPWRDTWASCIKHRQDSCCCCGAAHVRSTRQ